MSFADVAVIHQDPWIRDRVAACVALTGSTAVRPEDWVAEHAWQLAKQDGWGAAWEAARLASKDGIGADETVITDAMILAAVQALNATP